MRRKERPMSMGQIAIQRMGFRKGGQALTFAVCWWIVTRKLGRPPETVDEYSDWWKQSRATGYREQAVFRKTFPEFAGPMELAEWLRIDVYAVDVDKSAALVDLVGRMAPS